MSEFSIIHQNVQSLKNSINIINHLTEQHEDCKILCITEHWQKKTQIGALGLNNFKLGSSFCREGGYGGAAIYLHKDIQFMQRKKICDMSVEDIFECASVECKMEGMCFIIISLYTQPKKDMDSFVKKLESVLDQIINENKYIIMAGDFNIELMENSKHKLQFMSIMNSFNMSQTIFSPTRITATTKHCIDNIFTNFNKQHLESLVLHTVISDHTAQKIILKTNHTEIEKNSFKRFFDENSRNDFVHILKEQQWLEVYQINQTDVNKQWSTFMNTFMPAFNQCFPKKLVNPTQKSNNMYVNNENVHNVKNRLDICLMLKRQNNRYNEMYTNLKKEYDNLLAKTRAQNYAYRIRNADNKNKCMWSIYREITSHSDVGNTMMEGDPNDISNNYNEFLLKSVPDIMKDIPYVEWTHVINKNSRSIFLTPVDSQEILEVLKKIKNKHTSGDDEIPTSIIRQVVPAIIDVICYIMNNSLREGIFPETLKLSAIKPCYKNKGDINLMDNYRPLSLLPGFSKLFEVVMCKRIMTFLKDCEILSENQHGYMKGRSTHTAIFQFTRAILRDLEEGNLALGIFLDLSKAFDSLDRDLLLNKMEMYGIRGTALEWLVSYLNNRTQRVVINKNGILYKSKIMQNTVGVPQGSILGPVLFIIFMNDINIECSDVDYKLTEYADDTNLLVTGPNLCKLVEKTSDLFPETENWFKKNKLCLNAAKTGAILFRTKLNRTEKPDYISINGNQLTLKNNTKFLGVHIDEHLDWSFHIDCLENKLNSICFCIRTVSRYLNETSCRTLYFANFEGIARYGIIFWASNSKAQNIFVIQKRTIRTMYKMPPLQSCRGIFKAKRILTIHALYIYETILFTFKNRHLFDSMDSRHNYNTRTNDICFPRHRLTLLEKSPYYMGIKLFNKLNNDLKTMTQEKIFKSKLKKMLIELEPYSIQEYLDDI